MQEKLLIISEREFAIMIIGLIIGLKSLRRHWTWNKTTHSPGWHENSHDPVPIS